MNKKSIRYSNISLYFWVSITFIVCLIDLVLFVLFMVDYNTIMQRSYTVPLNFSPVTNSVLIAAQNTAGMLASIALRGYILWFINLVSTIYLFTQTFRIYDYNHTSEAVNKTTGQANAAFQNDEFQGHSIFKNQPISAYGEPVQ